MSNKKGLDLAFTLWNLFTSLACILACVYAVRFSQDSFFTLSSIMVIIALTVGMVYVFMGFTKDAAPYLRYFMGFAALSELASIADVANMNVTPFGACFGAVIYGVYIILTVGKDLGKKQSLLLCVILLVLSVVMLIGSISSFPGLVLGGNTQGTLYMIRSAAKVCLATTALLAIYAKYVDKASRGTK